MKKFLQCFFLLLYIITLAGCSKDDLMQRFAPAEDQAFAKRTLVLLKQKKFEDIEKMIDPSIKEANLRNSLIEMSALLPIEEPTKIKLIGAQQHFSNNQSSTNLTYEFTYPGKWIIVNVALKKSADVISIIGFHVNPQSTSIEEQAKFSFTGKSAIQYLIFVLAIIFPIVTIVALIICIRMKLKGRKWPWVIFILIGLCNLSMNWTTGEISFATFALQMFSASAKAAFYGPWNISISLPLGAVCFLIFRKNHAAEAIEPQAMVHESN
ncbi:hypothetical protein [Undibacterium danionis]|uniref:DUF3887 domain-containing protein n=1 Tax=Undibacterium danionis TaxID=1812100 RepID=A0ABV6IDL1_9BURK